MGSDTLASNRARRRKAHRFPGVELTLRRAPCYHRRACRLRTGRVANETGPKAFWGGSQVSKIVLCVDDSATMQQVADITFRGTEFTYVGARSYEEGLEKA